MSAAGVLAGCAFVALGVAAWTRLWVRWAAWDGPPAHNAPITVVPAFGVALICMSTGVLGLGVVGLFVLAAGLILFMARPRWYGPGWYRDRVRRGEIRLDHARAAATYGRVRGWWRAALDGRRGTLVLYDDRLAWQGLDDLDPRVIEAVSARADGRGELSLLLADGSELRLRAWRARRAAARIAAQ